MEQINNKTCAYKVQSLRTAYVDDVLEKCRDCNEESDENCRRYFEMGRTQQSIRRGLVACL